MTEQEIPEKFSVTGLLKRIISYETYHNSTTGPSGHSLKDTRITTKLEILTDRGKTIPIDFRAYIGSELVNQRVTYVAEGKVITGDVKTAVGTRPARQETITQKLLAQNENLPKYLASLY